MKYVITDGSTVLASSNNVEVINIDWVRGRGAEQAFDLYTIEDAEATISELEKFGREETREFVLEVLEWIKLKREYDKAQNERRAQEQVRQFNTHIPNTALLTAAQEYIWSHQLRGPWSIFAAADSSRLMLVSTSQNGTSSLLVHLYQNRPGNLVHIAEGDTPVNWEAATTS